MNLYLKNKTALLMIVSLLSIFFTVLPANAAKYETKDDAGQESYDLGKSFFTYEMSAPTQQQSNKEVKNNYQLISGLINNKQLEEAKVKLTSIIKKNPDQPIYYNLQALLQLISNDHAAAEQSFQTALDLNAKNAPAYTGLAKIALEHQKLNKAKEYANNALQINPYAVNAYKVLTDVAIQQDGMDGAEQVLLNANAKVKANLTVELEILKLLGKVYNKKNQPEKILLLAVDLVKRNKGSVSALSYLVGAKLVNQDINGAEQTLRQLISQEPNNGMHLFMLARLLSKQKDRETEVLSLLDKAALNLENPTLVLSYKIEILIKQNHYKQALEIAKQVDDSNPTTSLGKILKGNVYLAEKKYQEALQNFQRAYQISPSIKILDTMLIILTAQKKHKDVILLLQTELAKNNNNSAIQFRLAVAYHKSGKYDLSIKHYEKLLAKQQDNVILLNNLAWLYSQNRDSRALELAEKAYKIASKSAGVADTYGYILLKSGKIQESLSVLEQAAILAPESEEIQLHLAKAYIANQNKSKARKILQRLLSKENKQKSVAMKLMGEL